MDYKNELEKLLNYCKESANYITDEDCTEDKYARMAYRDVIGEIEKIFEREQESSDESAALPLHDVSNSGCSCNRDTDWITVNDVLICVECRKPVFEQTDC